MNKQTQLKEQKSYGNGSLTSFPSGKHCQKKSGHGRPTASLIASVRTPVISTEKRRPAQFNRYPFLKDPKSTDESNDLLDLQVQDQRQPEQKRVQLHFQHIESIQRDLKKNGSQELQNKSQRWAFAKARKKKQLYECEILHHQLKESSVNFLNAEEHRFTIDPSSLPDVLGLLTTSDNQIGLLITEDRGRKFITGESGLAGSARQKGELLKLKCCMCPLRLITHPFNLPPPSLNYYISENNLSYNSIFQT
ncbi:hypothetical protein KSP40_PGU002793 [Platanthera guangdongensis]|uniref:Uncharacterized protein n=1 Tax=Platanthera guangdongensis TaxID=2320717 RepID=A0ABR2LF43_9ASPA